MDDGISRRDRRGLDGLDKSAPTGAVGAVVRDCGIHEARGVSAARADPAAASASITPSTREGAGATLPERRRCRSATSAETLNVSAEDDRMSPPTLVLSGWR